MSSLLFASILSVFNVGIHSVHIILGEMPAVVFYGFYVRLFATPASFGFEGGEEGSFFFFSSFEASFSSVSIFSTFSAKYEMVLLLVATYLTHTIELNI